MAVAGTLEIEVLMNGKKVRVELNKLLKQMGMIQKSAKYTNKIFGRLARYASIGVLSKMAIDTAKLNKELGLTAERMGVSVESLSQMRNSFKGLGGDAKTFDRIVARINNGISRARIGDGQFVSALSSLTNVSPYDKNGKPRDYFDILKDLSDWTYLQSDKNVAFVKLKIIIQ